MRNLARQLRAINYIISVSVDEEAHYKCNQSQTSIVEGKENTGFDLRPAHKYFDVPCKGVVLICMK